MSLLCERAARGAMFLDKGMPGWFKKINLERLDIAFSNSCVIGQLGEANAQTGGDKFDFNDWRGRVGSDFAIKHGFYIRHLSSKNWKKQTEAWRMEIRIRLCQAA